MRDAITGRAAIWAVSEHLNVRRTLARSCLRLYEAGGRPVSSDALKSEICTESAGCLKSNIYQLRKAVGEGVIETNQPNGGYRLTPKGLSLVLCALNPP